MTLSRLHHALHMAAVTQIRYDTEGRVYLDRKLVEGKTKEGGAAGVETAPL